MQPAYGHPQFPVGSIFERLVHVRGQIRDAGVNPPLAQLVNGHRSQGETVSSEDAGSIGFD